VPLGRGAQVVARVALDDDRGRLVAAEARLSRRRIRGRGPRVAGARRTVARVVDLVRQAILAEEAFKAFGDFLSRAGMMGDAPMR
jgi:hypothetical protein